MNMLELYAKRADINRAINGLIDGRLPRGAHISKIATALSDVGSHIQNGLICDADEAKVEHLMKMLKDAFDDLFEKERLIAQHRSELKDLCKQSEVDQ